MLLTLGEAAKQVGVSKPTLSKAIASGKLSGNRREDGSWAIEPSELYRYVEANKHRFQKAIGEASRLETHAEVSETPETSLESLPLNVMRRLLDAEGKADQLAVCRDEIEKRVALLQAQLEEMRGHYDELKQQRDSWQAQAERLLLTYQAPAVTTPQPPAPTERRGVLGWFRRAG